MANKYDNKKVYIKDKEKNEYIPVVQIFVDDEMLEKHIEHFFRVQYIDVLIK